MYNGKNSCSMLEHTTTLKRFVVFNEYFNFEVLKDYYTLQGESIHNDDNSY
jgi:hypothetical protein